MSTVAPNKAAQLLKSLHQPGNPIILANVYDIISAKAVAALPSCKALATASAAVAAAHGIVDDDLTWELNLSAVRGIAAVAKEYNKPLTVDAQDGYGSRLEEVIATLIDHGVSGINLEDCEKDTQTMMSIVTASSRVATALVVARKHGVPDFAVNARTDALLHGGTLDEVIERGKAYLAAGATTAFVWGGSKRGVQGDEVVKLAKAFDGRLAVSRKIGMGHLSVKDLAKIGVSRISMGPQLQVLAATTYTKEAEGYLMGESV